MMFFPRLDAAD